MTQAELLYIAMLGAAVGVAQLAVCLLWLAAIGVVLWWLLR